MDADLHQPFASSDRWGARHRDRHQHPHAWVTWWSRRSSSAPIAGATTDFTVNVDCTPGTTYDKTGVVLNQANNWTVTYTGIPTGVSCVVTEGTVPAGWTLTSISPSPAVIGGTPVTVTVTNTRTVGDLVVKKVVVGPIAGATTDFTVNVDCTPGDTYDKTGVVLNQANNWTVTYTGIPTGVSCVVTEPVVPAGWTLTSISPTPAVIGGTPVTVTVTNTRNGIPGLDKTSAPADGVAQVAPGDLINYSVTVSNTGGLPITGPVVDTLPAGLTVVPTTITGGGTPNATNTVITWQVVNLAPGATLTFTYQAVVGDTVQTGRPLVNVVTFQGLQDSTPPRSSCRRCCRSRMKRSWQPRRRRSPPPARTTSATWWVQHCSPCSQVASWSPSDGGAATRDDPSQVGALSPSA